MADVKLDYKQKKGFWIHETYAQLIFQFIYAELQKPQYVFSRKIEILEDCKDIVNGVTNGYMALMWHELLINQSDEETMIQVLKNIIKNLYAKGHSITMAELKSMPSEDEHWKAVMNKDFPVNELIRIFNALIQILEGNWESTNYDMKINW